MFSKESESGMKRVFALMLCFGIMFTATTYSINAEYKTSKNSSVKYLESSLGIEIPNIDTRSIHSMKELNSDQERYLVDIGYTQGKIIKMDFGDYVKIYESKKVTDEDIELYIITFPELANKKDMLKNWTHSDYQKYVDKSNDKRFGPNESEVIRLKEKGITILDAKTLLKEYKEYDKIIEADSEVLKEKLEGKYKSKIKYLEKMNQMEEEKNKSPLTVIFDKINLTSYALDYDDIPSTRQIHYDKVYTFAGYRYYNDGFHVDTNTSDPLARAYQESNAAHLYRLLCDNSNASPYFTNMWGTYSFSSDEGNGACHEGIDMVLPSGSKVVKSVSPPQYVNYPYTKKDDVIRAETGLIAVYSEYYSRTFYYLHGTINQVSVGDEVKLSDSLFTESNINTKDAHLHFAVELNYSMSTDTANEDNLDSASPYFRLDTLIY
jgi:hypothetical protein